MKSLKQISIAAALAAFTLTGCGSNSNVAPSTPGKFDLKALRGSGHAQSAEEMALAAEQLAQSANFLYAVRLSNEALAIDPSNVRAKFWKAALAPSMELKGFITRLEPFAKQNSQRYQSYLQTKTQLQQAAVTKSLREFIFAGPKDITSENEIQDTISRVTLRMDDLRKTLKDLRTEELTIYRNPEAMKGKAAITSCDVKETTPDVIEIVGCDRAGAQQIRLNAADFEASQQIVAGYQVYVGLMNSYSFHGAVSVAEKAKSSRIEMTQELLKDPAFGRLHDGHTFAVLPELAVDAAMAARSAIQLQIELCANSRSTEWTRQGYLFPKGSCEMPADGFETALETMELVAKGPANIVFENSTGLKGVATNLPAFAARPMSDVRSLMPVQKDSCGNISRIQDPTFGGLFPNGQALEILDPKCN